MRRGHRKRPSESLYQEIGSVETIDRYLRFCFTRETSPRVSEFARTLGVSQATLVKAVKMSRGTTPAKYLKARQLACAKQLLRQGLSMERVARRAGYGSTRALFRSFKAATGRTPAAFRHT